MLLREWYKIKLGSETFISDLFQDVIKLTSRLPNLYASYDVPFAKWNHLDHLWGIDADTLVYAEVLKNMEQIRIENNIAKTKL